MESDLGTLGDLPVSPGHLGDRNNVEIFAAIQVLCGQAVADRLVVYDAWIQILMAQAADAVVKSAPKCRAWRRLAAERDIFVSAATISQMLSRYGSRDPDVRHMSLLLTNWAKQQHVRLPALTAGSEIESRLEALEPKYDSAANASTAVC